MEMSEIVRSGDVVFEITNHLSISGIEALYKCSRGMKTTLDSSIVVRNLEKRFGLRKCSGIRDLAILYYRRNLSKKSIRSLHIDKLLIVAVTKQKNSVLRMSLLNNASGLLAALDVSLRKGTNESRILLLGEVNSSFRELLSLSKKGKIDSHSISRAANEISRVVDLYPEQVSVVRREMKKLDRLLDNVEHSSKRKGIDDYPKDEKMSFVYDRIFGGVCGEKLRVLSGDKNSMFEREENKMLFEDIGF